MPVDGLPPDSLARVKARTLEDVAMQPNPRTTRTLVGATVGAALAIALVAVVGLAVLRPSTSPVASLTPGTTATESSPADYPGLGLCVEQYGPQTLGRRSIAFDGTVKAIKGVDATFHVNTPYRGVHTDTITLDATGMTSGTITLDSGPTLVVGKRYLVSGEDHFAWM